MKKLAAVLVALLLVSCSGGTDNEPIKPTRDDKQFTVVLNVVEDSKILETCSNLGVEYKANGCNAFDPNTKTCTIYVMKARYVTDNERLSVIGHELWHCRYGAYHQ